MKNYQLLFIAICEGNKKGMVFDFQMKEKLYLKIGFGYERTNGFTKIEVNINDLVLIPAESCEFDEGDFLNIDITIEKMKERGITLEQLNAMRLPENISLQIENYNKTINQ